MRILFLLLLFPFISFSQLIPEVGYKLELTNSFGLIKQTIIAFDSTTNDGFDICCDAAIFGGPNQYLGIYSELNGQYYAIMGYSKLITDRSVGLYTTANPDVIDFTINVVDTIGYENTILSISDSLFPEQRFNFPYNVTGPITGNRFRLHTSAPVKITPNNGCECDSGGSVFIQNPNYRWLYELFHDGNLIQYGDLGDTLITNLESGNYQYKWYNQTGNQTKNFEIVNNPLNFQLILPFTYFWIQDATIAPELIITGSYDSISWDFGDGTQIITNDTNPLHTYEFIGEFLLTVTLRSGTCIKTIQQIITVYDIFGFPNINQKNENYPYYYGIDGRLFKK